MRKRVAIAVLAGALAVPATPAAAAPAPKVPTEAGSPWPSMRHDRRNTGSTAIRGRYHRGDRPWRFRTGKGVFSTPVVAADETVYAGSADTWFYAIGRGGRLRWRFKTGEIIDSSGVLGRGNVTFGSGDEYIYRLRTAASPLSRRARTLWRFRATRKPAEGQLVNWWEGNVTMGFGGNLFAGNTGGAEYSLTPRGKLRWVHPAGNSVWSNAAIADDGTVLFGSLDLTVRAVTPRGKLKWQKGAGNFVTSSPALARDGTVYIGSFDGSLLALAPEDGTVRWRFQTDEHIYASPAIGRRLVYITSADGSIYALDRAGRLRWRYETGDPIRSSPALGRAPRGGGQILYVGSSNGSLYAIDAETGRRRWSYDTTPRDPVLRDRNDVNGSPALGRRGVYVGGEHGLIVHVPYDWCLQRRDPRCNTRPGEVFSGDLTRIAFVTPGGSTRLNGPDGRVPAATALGTRLLVRRGGETVAGALSGPAVSATPPFASTTQLSGDGRYLHVVPEGFLEPDTAYAVRVAGGWEAEGGQGAVDGTLRFRTAPVLRRGPPLATGPRRVSAFELNRLAVPLPPIVPSLNQIGFDSYDMVVGALSVSKPDAAGEGSLLLWAVSTKRGAGGARVADRRGAFAFPLAGRYRNDSVIVSQRGLNLTFSFGDVPLRRFELRMQLDRSLRSRGGGALYVEVNCPDVPIYGPAFIAIGLCNDSLTLPASGTFVTGRYGRNGPANRRPPGVSVMSLDLNRPTATTPGDAVATMGLAKGASFPASRHSLAILLTDADTGAPVSLDYKRALSTRSDTRGNLQRVRLRLPAGTILPASVRAYVIADVFPILARRL